LETAKDRYQSARAFRVSIQTRLKTLSRETGEPHLDLYRRVAIDRFLARIDWSRWVAKGGYILQRRLPKARRTKDIDLATADPAYMSDDSKDQQNALLTAFQEMARVDVGDYFEFRVRADKALPGFGKGGLRCQVTCRLDGQVWSTFQLDAVIQDQAVFPAESVKGDTFLSFAGLEPLQLKVPIKEEVFAEKIHAYTLPRERENTRVKDLLDLALLVADGLDSAKTKVAIVSVFGTRNTHDVSTALQNPPASWQTVFSELVADTGIDTTLNQAFDSVAAFYKKSLLD
jgi:hypothetical protein